MSKKSRLILLNEKKNILFDQYNRLDDILKKTSRMMENIAI